MVEIRLEFHIGNGVENAFGGEDCALRIPMGAKAAKTGDADLEAEAFGRRSGDAVVHITQVWKFHEPMKYLAGLFGSEPMEKGVGALLAFQGFDAAAGKRIDRRRI